MKAIVQDTYGPLDVLEFRDIPRPVPGEGEVLVEVAAAGVDPGVWHLTTGRPYLLRAMGFGVRGPKVRVRGVDVAGRVVAVGAGVTRVRPGDEVFGACDGAFAEYAVAAEGRLAVKPANLTFIEAASLSISGHTALQALRDSGKVRAGHHVLIIGAGGGVGSLAVQVAKSLGAIVTAVCGPTKVELVRSLGADDVIDYTRGDVDALARRYDVIIDTAGLRRLSLLRRVLTDDGTLVIVGGEGDGKWFGGVDRAIRAMLISPFVRQRLCALFSVERAADLDLLRAMAEDGRIKPVIDRSFAIADAQAAIAYVHEGHTAGKVVLTV